MSSKKNYTIQAPNATAVNTLRSWLRACGVISARSNVPGFDLTVVTSDGTDLEVKVGKRKDETLPGAGIQVQAGDLTGKHTPTALAAFWCVTVAAGYGRPQPLDRGAEPVLNAKGNPRKLHYKDEPFLVAIRHTEFRRSPNPSSDRWKKYASNIDKASAAFLRANPELCAREGVTIDDLKTYARCLVVNFCARYEIPEGEETWYDNERKCYSYLQQRFGNDVRTVLLKKERSVMPDAETVSIGLFGTTDANTEVSPDATEEEVDYDYIAQHCELDTSSKEARKASAAAKLGELLASLPHDQMIEVLVNARDNVHFDVATRREASRQLRLHAGTCGGSCPAAATDDSGIDEDEELADSDAASAAE